MSDSMSQYCPNCEAQAGEIVGLKAQLHMVLDREADTHCRHDAKVEALEAEIERKEAALHWISNNTATDSVHHAVATNALAGKAEQ
jgi:hypothetical protein